MSKWGKCDFDQLRKYAEQIDKFTDADKDKIFRSASQELAKILLNKVEKRTPTGVKPTFDGPKTAKVKGASGKSRSFLTRSGAILQQYWSGYTGGTLRDAWTIGDIEKVGDSWTVTIENNTEYASDVEYGHRQTPGRYVPALGKSLKASWVKGKFMLKITEQELERIAPDILEAEIVSALKEALG